MNELPWYAFLYRVLGAQGTFWLWLLTGLALWWTTEPALIRFVNRSPRPVALSKARQPNATLRWVQVEGLELSLDRVLLLRPESPTLPPMTLLLETGDPAARYWAETRAWVDLAEGSPGLTALGGGINALAPAAQKLLGRRYADLEQSPEQGLPAPGRAILIQRQGPAALTAPPAKRAGDDLAAAFRAELRERNERVRGAVRAVRLKGVLDPTPETYQARVESELGFRPSSHLIQADVRPSVLETRVFAGAALVLVFLVAGLWGATKTGLRRLAPVEAAGAPPAS
ncbi:MAG: hypothetical protein JKY65_02160 [Planctomycetes bacterium]|nr:hypothetical protein [Planctomycetota bacterium]